MLIRLVVDNPTDDDQLDRLCEQLRQAIRFVIGGDPFVIACAIAPLEEMELLAEGSEE